MKTIIVISILLVLFSCSENDKQVIQPRIQKSKSIILSKKQLNDFKIIMSVPEVRSIGLSIYANGKIEVPPMNKTFITVPFGGFVKSIKVLDGDLVKKGEELFQYMIHNYDTMFDGDYIKHFDVWYTSHMMEGYYDEAIKECGKNNIKAELIPWIRKEFETNNLFNSENWRPERDYDYCDMYLGYRKLFVYKQYYFQLQIVISV